MSEASLTPKPFDLVVIGGGVNGCGIARDAAGRGLRVLLIEKGDLGGATSSASTKLFHGGLRYLEFFEFRLVREALVERERLWAMMPHIAWPMRFILPLVPDLRPELPTPASRLANVMMPWLRGRRPAWMVRAGLFLYDHLGGRRFLPGTTALPLPGSPEGEPLRPQFRRAYEYSDVWVDDARLVILNARDAAARGATIWPRCELLGGAVFEGLWRLRLAQRGVEREVWAKAVVNAAGPWVGRVLSRLGGQAPFRLRLVKGAHLVLRRLYRHEKAYVLPGRDGRIVFTLPFADSFTLLGTTEVPHEDPDTPPLCTTAERDYLFARAQDYFLHLPGPHDVVASFAGVRPLWDDGAGVASAVSRDWRLHLDTAQGAPALHVFGGKITTYRRLAEAALDQLRGHFPWARRAWTAGAALPGGDFPIDGVNELVRGLIARHPFLTKPWALRLVRAYGTEAEAVLGGARRLADLGRDFGGTLFEAELTWMAEREWAETADDALWRRSKLALVLSAEQKAAVAAWFEARRGKTSGGDRVGWAPPGGGGAGAVRR